MEFTDEIVKQFEAMIAGIAWFYTADPTTHKDLMQTGYAGLRKACEQYKPSKGGFSTYAHLKARSEMKTYMDYKHRLVHYPIAHEFKYSGFEIYEFTQSHDETTFATRNKLCVQSCEKRVEMDDLLSTIDEHMPDIIREHFMEGVSVTKLAEQHRETRDSIRAKIEAGLNELREVVA